jgi:hypothetical protein
MAEEKLPVIAGQGAEGVLPRSAPRYRQEELRQKPPDYRIEEHRLRGEVPVQRHGLDAQRRPETPHRQRVEALAVNDLDRGCHDPLGRERLAP